MLPLTSEDIVSVSSLFIERKKGGSALPLYVGTEFCFRPHPPLPAPRTYRVVYLTSQQRKQLHLVKQLIQRRWAPESPSLPQGKLQELTEKANALLLEIFSR